MSIERNRKKAPGKRVTGLRAIVIVSAGLLLFGCESSSQNTADDGANVTPEEAEIQRRQMEVQVQGATATQEGQTLTVDYPVLLDRNDMLPDWVINPGLGGILGAVGVARPTVLGTKEQLNEARLNARLEMAQMLELRLQGVDREQLEQQLQASGPGLQDNSRKSILAVDRSITDIVLAGTRQRALWFDPDNDECYVWMVLDGKVLEMVDHYITEDVSVFIANTPISSEYRPVRRKPQAPRVIVEAPQQVAPPPPAPKEPIEELEGKLKDIETIPVKEDGKEGQ